MEYKRVFSYEGMGLDTRQGHALLFQLWWPTRDKFLLMITHLLALAKQMGEFFCQKMDAYFEKWYYNIYKTDLKSHNSIA